MPLTLLDHYKLEVAIYPDHVIQTDLVSDRAQGRRKIKVSEKWCTQHSLGEGGFGSVFLQVVDKDEDKRRAVKKMEKAWMGRMGVDYRYELKALAEFSQIKHRTEEVFVDFYGWFEDPTAIYLAMEYIPLGDLAKNVPGTLAENEVKDITIQVLEGLKIMHLENFAHRDLKLENILVVTAGPNWWIKIGDFGLSKQTTEDTALRTVAGTRPYQAPEQLFIPVEGVDQESSVYTNAVDIWAVGCVVYRLLIGNLPFPTTRDLHAYCRNQEAFRQTIQQESPTRGPLASELLMLLLQPAPGRRPDAAGALLANWFTPTRDEVEVLKEEIRRLKDELHKSGRGMPGSKSKAGMAVSAMDVDVENGLRIALEQSAIRVGRLEDTLSDKMHLADELNKEVSSLRVSIYQLTKKEAHTEEKARFAEGRAEDAVARLVHARQEANDVAEQLQGKVKETEAKAEQLLVKAKELNAQLLNTDETMNYWKEEALKLREQAEEWKRKIDDESNLDSKSISVLALDTFVVSQAMLGSATLSRDIAVPLPSPEAAAAVLQNMVPEWNRGFPFRFGQIELFTVAEVQISDRSWERLGCFWFSNVLIFAQFIPIRSTRQKSSYEIRGEVLVAQLRPLFRNIGEKLVTWDYNVDSVLFDIKRIHLRFEKLKIADEWEAKLRALLDGPARRGQQTGYSEDDSRKAAPLPFSASTPKKKQKPFPWS